MCGLAGFVNVAMSSEQARDQVVRMSELLKHRGPDDCGYWLDAATGLALGHRRLSVVDLSSAGHQPMESASKRFVLAYNGEIYNHNLIRREILAARPDATFRGHSDTEVMLHAFELWGLRGALDRFNGMFAFALFDRRARLLHLARDRLGEKPLYVAQRGESIVFASELRPIHYVWRDGLRINPQAVRGFLRFGYVPGPESIFDEVRKVQPGQVLTFSLSSSGVRLAGTEIYWDPVAVVVGSEHRAIRAEHDHSELEELLRDAVRVRMEADVPLGAFLSGGIDSSLVVGLMQSQSSRPVKTFTIGFSEDRFDEAQYARAVARHLHTDHTELYVSASDALEVVPRLPAIFDEPFADSSQIPTFLVAQLARKHVTVVLSGDGGDELFGGYSRYPHTLNLWSSLRAMPEWVRKAISAGIRRVPISAWNTAGVFVPRRISADRFGDRMHKFADFFSQSTLDGLYAKYMSLWDHPDQVLIDASPGAEWSVPPAAAQLADPTHRMMAWDLTTYLPDDILVKVDRAAMAVSLEGRIPLLDHRVVEYAWRMPLVDKATRTEGKIPLRTILHRYVPKKLVDRPKMGFGVPIEYWLREDLRDWAGDLLSQEALKRHGLFASDTIREMLDDHMRGRRSWASQIWAVLMFQAWHQEYFAK
jgi:asparagine synthase (glutamine-hydrolysing)